MIQIRRVLKPDGLFLGCLLGGSEPQRTAERSRHRRNRTLRRDQSAHCAFCRCSRYGRLAAKGGGSPCRSPDSEPLTVPLPGYVQADDGFARYGGPLTRSSRACASFRRADCSGGRRRFTPSASAIPDGLLRATFEMIFVSGWAPHESQQKPLRRRGSAKMRLEDALAGGKAPFYWLSSQLT